MLIVFLSTIFTMVCFGVAAIIGKYVCVRVENLLSDLLC